MALGDPSEKIVRVQSPTASPGVCGNCGVAKHPNGFAFMGMDFEFYGTLFFCAECCQNLGALFGCAPESVTAELKEMARDAHEWRTRAEAAEAMLNQITGALNVKLPATVVEPLEFTGVPDLVNYDQLDEGRDDLAADDASGDSVSDAPDVVEDAPQSEEVYAGVPPEGITGPESTINDIFSPEWATGQFVDEPGSDDVSDPASKYLGGITI